MLLFSAASQQWVENEVTDIKKQMVATKSVLTLKPDTADLAKVRGGLCLCSRINCSLEVAPAKVGVLLADQRSGTAFAIPVAGEGSS
jgi:hypothetical protein